MELFTSKTDPGITWVIHLKDEESEVILNFSKHHLVVTLILQSLLKLRWIRSSATLRKGQ